MPLISEKDILIEAGRHSDRGGVFILLWRMNMKKRKKKGKEKLSRRELLDLMGVHRDTYKRVRGAIRRK